MSSEVDAVDAEEDAKYGKVRRGDALPEALQTRESRLKRLRECKERLEREAQEKKAAQKKKIEDRRAAETLEAAGVKGKVGIVSADAGHCSEKNLANAPLEGPELFVSVTKDWKQRKRRPFGRPRLDRRGEDQLTSPV